MVLIFALIFAPGAQWAHLAVFFVSTFISFFLSLSVSSEWFFSEFNFLSNWAIKKKRLEKKVFDFAPRPIAPLINYAPEGKTQRIESVRLGNRIF